MRTNKRYTNTTFTRRVDREAGLHRGAKAPKERRVCRRCGAVYERRHWAPGTTPRSQFLRALSEPIETVCPGCRLVITGQYRGEVRLAGSFVAEHADEIERLLRNEAARTAAKNPTAEIVSWRRPARSRVIIRTSTEHLAQVLGRALYKAYRGSVHYEFSHENKFAHVTWTRDLQPNG